MSEKKQKSSEKSIQEKYSFWEELKLIGRIWPFMSKDAWVFVVALIATPVIALGNLAQPYFIKEAIDNHFSIGAFEGLENVAFMYFGAVLLSYVLSAVYSIGISWGGTRMLVRLRLWLFKRVLSLSQSFFDRRPAGMLLTRLTSDVDAIAEVIGAGIITIVLDFLMIFGCLIAMLIFDPVLTLLLLLCSPVLLFVVEVCRQRLKKLYLFIRDAISSVNSFLSENIDGVEIIQLFGIEDRTETDFDVRNKSFRDASVRSNFYDALMFAVVDGFSSILIGLLLWFGSGALADMGLVEVGSLRSAGLMVAFIDYLNRLLTPIRDISSKISVIQRALAALSKIFGLVDDEQPVERTGKEIQNFNGHLQLIDLYFSYAEDGPDVLKGINLEIQSGEVIAIVGSSGSGKTTLSRLLDQSYQGYRGSILVDGVELRELSLPSTRENIASVRQDIQIFSRSLQFNVDLENPKITQENRDHAVEMTCSKLFIERLGWEHVLRERGADLSVGEGQLLSFARAMAYNANLVILDEATASIDSVTEGQIQRAIENIFAEKTVIVIAHRLSTIQKADRIVVLEKGKIVEQGTHQELLKLEGRYFALVEAGKAAIA